MGSELTLVRALPPPRFRVLCQTIIAHRLFDYVVLAFIFLNCITIALERPQIEAGSTVSSHSPQRGQAEGATPGRPWTGSQAKGELSVAGLPALPREVCRELASLWEGQATLS